MFAPVIYAGVEWPALAWARSFGGLVVLRRFHPLVTSGQFADVFPQAQRFISVAPTLVGTYRATAIYAGAMSPLVLPHLKYAFWLNDAVSDAAQATRLPGVHGLYICDIDILARADRELALEYLQALSTSTQLALNGGLSILPSARNPDAIVLTDLDREYGTPFGRKILREAVPALAATKARGAKIYRIETGERPARKLPRAVARVIDTTTTVSIERSHSWEPWYHDTSTLSIAA